MTRTYAATIDGNGRYVGWASRADIDNNPAAFKGLTPVNFEVDVLDPLQPTAEEWEAIESGARQAYDTWTLAQVAP